MLEDNNLRSISPETFVVISNLTILSLKSIQLTELPTRLLENFRNLNTLNLENNQFMSLSTGFGSLNPNLGNIYLGSNQLSSLPVGLLADMHPSDAHIMLDLFNNDLTTIPDVFGPQGDPPAVRAKLYIGNNSLEVDIRLC